MRKRGDGRILGLPQHADQVGNLGLLGGGGAYRVLTGVVLGKVAHVGGLLLGLGLLHHGAAGLVPQLEGEISQCAGEHHEQGHDDHEHATDATRLLEMRMLHRIGLAVAAARLGEHGGRDLVAEHGLVAWLEALHRIGIVFRGVALVLEAGGMRAVGGRDGREGLGQAERRVAVGRAALLGGVAGADGRERLGQTQGCVALGLLLAGAAGDVEAMFGHGQAFLLKTADQRMNRAK